jgi:glutamate dehydrogenase/leucine dehydrogenase
MMKTCVESTAEAIREMSEAVPLSTERRFKCRLHSLPQGGAHEIKPT